MTKRLYRSRTNKVLEGVCAGVGNYFDVDPVLIRLIYILMTCFTGFVPGIAAYIIAMLIIPEEPKTVPEKPAEPKAKEPVSQC